MKPSNFRQMLVASILGVMASQPLFAEEDSLTLIPTTGNYLLRYTDDDGVLVEMTVIPPTKVKPVFSSQFLAQTSGNTRYQYQVAVEASSPQGLEGFRMDVSSALIGKTYEDAEGGTPAATPPGWDGDIIPSLVDVPGVQRISWFISGLLGENEMEGLRPGSKASGFIVDSTDLPGIVIARLRGSTPIFGFPGESPSGPLSEEISDKISMAFVPRFAAAPLIPVRTPWNPRETIGALQDHVLRWGNAYPDSIGQLDEVVHSEVQNRFAVIVGAVDRGDQQGALDGINGLLGYIRATQNKYKPADLSKVPHEGVARATPQWPITNLAARALTYDLGYILNRLKKEPLTPQPEQY
jgi:hypothetical protein